MGCRFAPAIECYKQEFDMGKLVKCKDCGNEITKKAASCPSCGSPQKVKSGRFLGCSTPIWVLLIGTIVALVALGPEVTKTSSTQGSSDNGAPASEEAPKPKSEDEIAREAAIRCKEAAKQSAEWGYDADWGLKYQAYKMEDGAIRIIARDIKFKNGFGAERYATYTGIFKDGYCVITSVE